MFAREDLDKLLEAVRIEEIAEAQLETRSSGKSIMACCPFHDERTPSFSISAEKQFFHCFGCEVSGDAIDLTMELESLTFPEAVRKLAKEANIDLKETYVPGEQQHDPTALLEINEKAAQFFQSQWHPQAQAFLDKREIPNTLRDKWGIGYVPDGRELLSYLRKEGTTEEELRTLGFISERGYPFFNNRLIWTLRDHLGRPVGFSARRIFEQDTYSKFVNTPETPVFKKREVLYGLFQNKTLIKETKQVIVCEGFADVIAYSEIGLPAVSVSGTAIGELHARRLARPLGSTGSVIMSLDGDKAGIAASEKAIPLFTSHPMKLLGAVLPSGQDPDEFKRNYGAQALHQVIDQAQDLIGLCIQRHMPADAEPETIRRSGQEIAKIVGTISDPLLKQAWKQRVEASLHLSLPRVNAPVPKVKNIGLDQMMLSFAYKRPDVFSDNIDAIADTKLFPEPMLPVYELVFSDASNLESWRNDIMAMGLDKNTLLKGVPADVLESTEAANRYLHEMLKRLQYDADMRAKAEKISTAQQQTLTLDFLDNLRKELK